MIIKPPTSIPERSIRDVVHLWRPTLAAGQECLGQHHLHVVPGVGPEGYIIWVCDNRTASGR